MAAPRWLIAVFAALLCVAAAAADVPFHQIKTCQECLESGHAWCPIRRACGGFSSRTCFGGNDERDYRRVRVAVITDADVEALDVEAVSRSVLMYNPGTSSEILDSYEDAVVELEFSLGGATRGHGLFLSVDLAKNKRLRATLGVEADDSRLPLLRVFSKHMFTPLGDDEDETDEEPESLGPFKPDVDFAGPWEVEDIHQFLKTAASVRIPSLDVLVQRFVESLMVTLTGTGEEVENATADMALILEDAVAALAKLPSAQTPVAALYIDTMVQVLSAPTDAMVWLATTVNHLKSTGVMSNQLEVLQVFTNELLG